MANQKIGEFINGLAVKAGIPTDNPELKTFLSDPACLVEIDAKISDAINSGLMNESAALNNKKIIDALVPKGRAEAYDNIDKAFNEKILDLLSDEDKTAFASMKFSTDKIGGLKDVIAKLKEGKKDAKGSEDVKVFQAKIDELNLKLKTAEAEKVQFENNLTAKYENDSIESNLKMSLFGRNWKLPTETEADKLFAVETASLKVKSELAAKGYKLVRENGILTLKTNENLKVTDAHHNEVPLSQFIDGAVSALIAPAKTDPAPKPLGGGGTGNNNGRSNNVEGAKAQIAESLAAFG